MKRKFPILIVFLTIALSYSAIGQDTYINSLNSIYTKTTDDSLQLELLGVMCFHTMTIDSLKSAAFCQKGLDLCKKAENKYAVANMYRTAGIFYNYFSDYSNAEINYTKALKLFRSINTENGRIGYAKTCYNFGLYYNYFADYTKELEMYNQAIPTFEKHKIDNFTIAVYNRIANIYGVIGDFENEKKYKRKLIALASSISDSYSLKQAYLAMGDLYSEKSMYDSACYYFDKLKMICEKDTDYEVLSTCYSNIAFLENQRNNNSKALIFALKAFDYTKMNINKNSEAYCYYQTGLYYFKMKRISTARDTLLSGLAHSRKYKFKEYERKIIDVLAELESVSGNYKLAFDYKTQYEILYQDMMNEEKQKQLSNFEIKYKTKEQSEKIKELEYQRQIDNIKLQKRMLALYALSALALSMLAAAFFIYKYYTKKRQLAFKELELQQQKFEKLQKENQLTATQSALRGEESERHRIAKELHDGLGGLLSGIKLTLTGMRGNYIVSQESVNQFDRAIRLMDESIQELRSVAHNMMPEALLKFGLKDALSDFCDNLNHTNEINIVFAFFGTEKRYDKNFEINVYRIVQELMNNALKYAQASEIIVQMIVEESRYHLTVQDNGIGFDPEILKHSKGNGFANVQSRVSMNNGRIDIISKKGNGTEISIEFDI